MRVRTFVLLAAVVGLAVIAASGCGSSASAPSTSSPPPDSTRSSEGTPTTSIGPSSTSGTGESSTLTLSDYEELLKAAGLPVQKVSVVATDPRVKVEIEFPGPAANVPVALNALSLDDWIFWAARVTAQAKAKGFAVDELSIVGQESQGAQPVRMLDEVKPWSGAGSEVGVAPGLAFAYFSDVLTRLANADSTKQIDLSMSGQDFAHRWLRWTLEKDMTDDEIKQFVQDLASTLDDLNTQGAMITKFTLTINRHGLPPFRWVRELETGATQTG